MAVEFCCKNCRSKIIVAAGHGADLVCPQCGMPIRVPGDSASARSGPSLRPAPIADRSKSAHGKSPSSAWDQNEMRRTLAKALPWVVSLSLHVVVALVMTFAAMIVIRNRAPEGQTIPDAFLSDLPGGVMRSVQQPEFFHTPKAAPAERRQASRKSNAIDAGRTEDRIELIAAGGGGGSLSPFSLESGGQSSVKTSFYGSGGNAHNIVYVVDRSGSMIDSFGFVRLEILRSVSRLKTPQRFHVILFASGEPLENPPERLVPADFRQKERAAEFLSNIRPEGKTDPTPALKRAFAVLGSSSKLPGRLIYLLTDGLFQDNAKVINAIRKANPSGKVLINTYLYGHRPPKAVEIMEQIARENGGSYRYIPADE